MVFEARGFAVRVFGGSGTSFFIIYSRFSRLSGWGFRGSGFLGAGFSRYGVSGSLLRVFAVRGFEYGVS